MFSSGQRGVVRYTRYTEVQREYPWVCVDYLGRYFYRVYMFLPGTQVFFPRTYFVILVYFRLWQISILSLWVWMKYQVQVYLVSIFDTVYTVLMHPSATNSKLNCLYTNADSLLNKINELQQEMYTQHPGIIYWYYRSTVSPKNRNYNKFTRVQIERLWAVSWGGDVRDLCLYLC